MIHLDDVVAAVLLLARRPEAAGKTYIVTDGELYSTYEIYRQVCIALDRPVPRWTTPIAWLRIAATAGDWLTGLSGRPAPFHSATLKKLVGCAWYRGERIVRDLGFTPQQNLRTALPGMVAFHRGARHGG